MKIDRFEKFVNVFLNVFRHGVSTLYNLIKGFVPGLVMATFAYVTHPFGVIPSPMNTFIKIILVAGVLHKFFEEFVGGD